MKVTNTPGNSSRGRLINIRDCFLDPMALPEIVSLAKVHSSALLELVFFMTKTYAYSIHRQKMIVIGKWPSGRDKPKHDPKNNVYKINQFSLSDSTLADGLGKTPDGSLVNQIQHPSIP